MKINLLMILMLLSSLGFTQQSQISKQTAALNKEIFKIIKKQSLFSSQMNWNEIENENKVLPFQNNDSINQQIIFDFYTQKLRAVGDKHSFFISTQKINELNQTPAAEAPQGEYLGDGIGWIKVPRCLTFDDAKDLEFANTIRYIIEKIDQENTIEGWIVDLRHNTGGNMWPMLAGLNALIDDGIAGYFVKGKSKTAWQNNNGKISGKSQVISSYKIKNNKVKIAVLIDGRTGSSGEMTAVSFLGLPNVKSFGQTSAGYITANQTHQLSNGAQLLLASTYVMDRTGKSYKDEIVPDVVVADLSNTKDDEVVKAAKKWILE